MVVLNFVFIVVSLAFCIMHLNFCDNNTSSNYLMMGLGVLCAVVNIVVVLKYFNFLV